MNEQQLTIFFEGLDERIKNFREMRGAFDERVAFDFNMLSFFNPREPTISKILAFFLSPHEKHGQKAAFLRRFLLRFKVSDAQLLLDEGAKVNVKCEYHTDDGRHIDIVVFFGGRKFAVGIENKIWAADQKNQVRDYCRSLYKETDGKYVLFYLTPDRHSPSSSEPEGDDKQERDDKYRYQCIDYEDIRDLLDDYETVCRADNVRGFIRQFQQHIKQEFLGEKVMSDQLILDKYVREHPEMWQHFDALAAARNKIREKLREGYYSQFWDAVERHLPPENVEIEETKQDEDGYSCWDVMIRRNESVLNSDKLTLRIYYDWRRDEVYICADPNWLKGNASDFQNGMKAKDATAEYRDSWPAAVQLPNPFSDKSLGQMKDTEFEQMAKQAAATIEKYAANAESVWQQISHVTA
jgi:hypothetical protein